MSEMVRMGGMDEQLHIIRNLILELNNTKRWECYDIDNENFIDFVCKKGQMSRELYMEVLQKELGFSPETEIENVSKSIDYDKLAVTVIEEFENDREESGRSELANGLFHVLGKYKGSKDRAIIDDILMAFTGWKLDTLLDMSKEVLLEDTLEERGLSLEEKMLHAAGRTQKNKNEGNMLLHENTTEGRV